MQAGQAVMGLPAHTSPSHLPAPPPRVVPAWHDALEWCPSMEPVQPGSLLWHQRTALPCWAGTVTFTQIFLGWRGLLASLLRGAPSAQQGLLVPSISEIAMFLRAGFRAEP